MTTNTTPVLPANGYADPEDYYEGGDMTYAEMVEGNYFITIEQCDCCKLWFDTNHLSGLNGTYLCYGEGTNRCDPDN